jgi:hypothetical protein
MKESWVGSDQERFTKLEGGTLTHQDPAAPHAPGRQTVCYHPGMAEERLVSVRGHLRRSVKLAVLTCQSWPRSGHLGSG